VGSGVLEIAVPLIRIHIALSIPSILEKNLCASCIPEKILYHIRTPKKEIDLIKRRLKMAIEMEIENE